ncbi:MAG: prepilin peptidase [Aquificaceae bacterium]
MEPVQVLEYVFIFLIGLALGSFYNVLIYRLPRNMSIFLPPSHCPHCQSRIRWYDNIPVLSYLLLKGRCRHCGGKISIRYPLVELSTGLLALLSKIKFEDLFLSFLFFLFFSILLVASLIDWDTFTLPDSLTLGGLALGLLTSLLRQDLGIKDSLFGAFLGFAIFFLIYLYYTKVRKIEGLGFGDVKLMAFIGSAFGVWGVVYALFLGSIFGLLYALPMIIKHRNMQFALPYGPFLSLGVFVGVMLNLKDLFL